jgi:hypothetical protein
MTVCTSYLAFRDLVDDALPATVAEALGDAECFVPEVVELQHERVGLPAVHAGSIAEERHEIRGALGSHCLLAT